MNPHPPGSIRNGRHHYATRVYYADTDAGGVVYHATYLAFAERARTEALRDLEIPAAELQRRHGLIFMVRRVKLDYVAPATVDDSLIVVSQPLDVGAASVLLRQAVHLELSRAAGEPGRLLAAAEVQLACVRLETKRAARLPEAWRDGLRGMLAAGGSADLT